MQFTLLTLLLFIFSNAWALDCEQEKQLSEYRPIYAKLFSIQNFQDFKIVQSNKDRFLVSEKKTLNCTTTLPVFSADSKRFVATSTTHLAFLTLLSLEKALVGFQGVRYIYNSDIRKQKIKDIHYQMNPEELLSLKADLIMAYSANLSSKKRLNDLRKVGVPIVLNHDFEEKHPLARAEWIIFSAVFFSKDDEAKKIFKDIVENYNKTKEKALSYKDKADVLVGEIQNGKWATCGGRSDLAIMIDDAGGKTFLKNESLETQYISLEQVLTLKNKPTVWLSQNTWINKDLVKKDSRYKNFSETIIYNNNNKVNSDGFNDYWEMGMARPDLMLKDLYNIFHSDKKSNPEFVWYKELK